MDYQRQISMCLSPFLLCLCNPIPCSLINLAFAVVPDTTATSCRNSLRPPHLRGRSLVGCQQSLWCDGKRYAPCHFRLHRIDLEHSCLTKGITFLSCWSSLPKVHCCLSSRNKRCSCFLLKWSCVKRGELSLGSASTFPVLGCNARRLHLLIGALSCWATSKTCSAGSFLQRAWHSSALPEQDMFVLIHLSFAFLCLFPSVFLKDKWCHETWGCRLWKKYPPVCRKYCVSPSISFQAEISVNTQLLWRAVILKGLFPAVFKSSESFPCFPSEFGACLLMSYLSLLLFKTILLSSFWYVFMLDWKGWNELQVYLSLSHVVRGNLENFSVSSAHLPLPPVGCSSLAGLRLYEHFALRLQLSKPGVVLALL